VLFLNNLQREKPSKIENTPFKIKERWRVGQRVRETEGQRDRETERQRDKETESQREKKKETQRHRYTQILAERHR
jgi:hypothetical protein